MLVSCAERLDRQWRMSQTAAHPVSKPQSRPAPANKALLAKGKLAMPVLAIGGEKSFGATMAVIMHFAATDVQSGVIPD